MQWRNPKKQGPKIIWVKKKTVLNFKGRKSLKLQSWTTLYPWNNIFETFLNNNMYMETAKAM